MTAADQQVRDRALDIDHSFAVSAPAGSGKTGLLIRRILRLLAVCDQPEQVLAITFTRKAAAEMQSRIVEALQLARTETPPEDDYQRAIWHDARQVLARDAACNWQLIAAPARLRIMTIDSLCRNLARQLAVETTLGELPEPSEQPEFIYREAIRGFFAQLDKPGPVGDALALLLGHLDNNLGTLETLLESLLARREQWLEPLLDSRDARHTLEQTLRNTVAETLAGVGAALAVVAGELVTLADYAAANLAESASPVAALAGITALPATTASAANLASWQALSDLLLTKGNTWRSAKGISKREGFPTKKDSLDPANAELRKEQLNAVIAWCREQPGLQEQLVDLRNLPGVAYSDNQWQLLDALTLILPVLVAELSVLFKARHSCDFTEITLAALDALGSVDADGDFSPGDLSLKLDYQIRHILVDEFQDTSSLQFRLLRQLTQGWQRGDGRTLFIVGDGMQSLYGFRNANVGIFLEARKLPIGDIHLEPLDLAVNFRSDSTVVNWVNSVFSRVFPPREDISRGAVSYAPAIAARENLCAPAVTLDVFAEGCTREAEADQVVARIRRARALDPEGSIAILTRARSHLTAILAALRREGIDWEATDIDPLASRMAVIDLHSLTRALLNPGDRIAWLAVLRAPWCGLGLRDLHALVNSGQTPDAGPAKLPWLPGQIFAPESLSALSADGRSRLARVGPVLQAAWDNRLRKPLRQWLEGTWLALGGPATLLNSAEQAWCEQYLDLLEAHSKGSEPPDLDQFAEGVAKLYARPAAAGHNPVQIMTIHKSKGLEFDTVILPALHKGGGGGDSTLLYWRERINARGRAELLIAPPLSQADGDNDGGDRLVGHLKYEAKLKSALEDARVAYVACTRASKRLHLLYTTPKNSPASGSLLAALWDALEGGAGNGELTHHDAADTTAEVDDGGASLTEILRLAANWRHPCPAGALQEDQDGQPERPNLPTLAARTSGQDDLCHAGTVLHRTLARIVKEGVETWDHGRLERQRDGWRIQLRALGVDNAEPLLELLQLGLSKTLADDTGRWLLAADHHDSACELAIGHSADSGPAISVIDRTFVADGVRWIIDYKSSAPAGGEPLALFLARETTAYGPQLAKYRGVFQRRDELPVRTALYFPLIPLLHEVAG